MRLFDRLSIKNKLMAMILAVTTTALLAAFVFVAIDAKVTFEQQMVDETKTAAHIASEFLAAGLAAGLDTAVGPTLTRLNKDLDIIFASFYDEKGHLVSSVGEGGRTLPLHDASPSYHEFKNDTLYIFHAVDSDDKKFGTLHLKATTEQLYGKITTTLGKLLLAWFTLLGFSFYGAFRLQRNISRPLLHLAKTVRAISMESDYSLRLAQPYKDEIGTLYDGFNEMLASIEQRDATLKKKEAQYRTLFEQAGDAIFISDSEGKYVDVNPSACELVGYDKDELLKFTFSHLIPDEDLQSEPLQLDDLKDGKVVTRERRVRRKDKRILTVELNARMLDDGRIQVFARDITERKRAGKNIKEQARLLDLIFEHSLDSIVLLDKDYNFIRVSETYAKACQRDSSEFPGHNHFEFYPSNLKDEVDEAKKGKFIYKKTERPFIFPDHPEWGTTYWDLGLVPILDPEGEIELFLFTLKDVTERKLAEEALHESEQRYRSLFENVPISIWEEDFSEVKEFLDNLDGVRKGDFQTYLVEHADIVQACARRVKIVDVNQATLRLHNAADKAELLSGLESTFTDASFETFRKELVAIAKGETAIQAEGTIKTLDGRKRDIDLRWSVAPGFERSLARVLVTIEDITERKIAEEKLHKINEQLQISIENMPSAYILWDQDLHVVEWNKAAEEIFGYSKPEMLGKNPVDYIVPKSARHLVEDVLRRLETGDVADYSEKDNNIRKDGKLISCQWFNTPLADKNGDIFGIFTLAQDITERMQAEAALQESEERFRGLVKSAPDAIVTMDARGHIVLVNAQTEKLFDYQKDELLDQPIEMLLPERFHQIHVGHRDKYLADPNIRPMGSELDLLGRRKDGSEFQVEISLSSLETTDGLLVTGVIRDITERRQAEEKIKAALAEKEIMLKEIHHRVKNNLQVISSLLNLQARHIKDKEALAIFTDSRSRVRSMALIHEKLYRTKDFSKVDFADYARDLSAQLFRAYNVDAARIKFDLDVGDIHLAIDVAVPCGLIMNELLSNCLSHAFPGGGKGTVRLKLHSKTPQKRQPGNGSPVVLTVSDDGVGLPAGFDISKTNSLGMQLVKTLSAQIDAVLQIKSGKGAHFTITFETEATEKLDVSVIEN